MPLFRVSQEGVSYTPTEGLRSKPPGGVQAELGRPNEKR